MKETEDSDAFSEVKNKHSTPVAVFTMHNKSIIYVPVTTIRKKTNGLVDIPKRALTLALAITLLI